MMCSIGPSLGIIMASSVVELTTAGGPVEQLGGKGKALARLVVEGFPVPPTVVVTTDAYRQAMQSPEVEEVIADIVAGTFLEAEVVDKVFARAPVDPVLTSSIVEEVRRIADGSSVAVRSSATVEDLHGSSFAGQYRSLLDVDGSDADEVMAAVRHVWGSLWHPAPTAYRRAFGIDDSDVAMAVVVMVMVPATTAGVVFTVDPGGEPGSARVESVEGLGESLVSGARTPSAWVVRRDDHRELPRAAATALELALQVEDSFGVPQDVEWAADTEQVYVVQARPITVLADGDGFDSLVDDHELTTAGIAETVPGVIPPLHWDYNRLLLEEALRSVLDSLGLLVGEGSEDRALIRRVRGRVVVDFDQLRAMAASTPGAAEELERQYFGFESEQKDSNTQDKLKMWRRRPQIGRQVRTLRTRRKASEQAEIVIGATRAYRSRRPLIEELETTDLVRAVRRLVDLAARGLAAEVGVAAAAGAAVQRLIAQLAPHLGQEVAESVALDVVGDIHRDQPMPWASAAVFAGPTWTEVGGAPDTPRASNGDGLDKRARLEADLVSTPGWKRTRILTGQIVDVRMRLVRRTILDAIELLERREAVKAAVFELGGDVRRLERELGRRLSSKGILAGEDDVELLSWSELVAAVEDGADIPTPDVLRRRRSWLDRYRVEGELPVRFRGTPDREPEPLPSGDVLDGWAASAGRARGRARVVSDPNEHFEAGDVLVAAATDASWSPLFVKASAVVVERGGPLSHAAILARELGLPAVLNVAGACAVLDRCVVSVDGGQGKVVIEERAEVAST